MWLWVAFGVIITISFILDVGLCGTRRQTSHLSIRQAITLSIIWILVAFAFNIGLYIYTDTATALQFLASYLLEKGLSVDNVFVFYIIFEHFQIPERFQRRVLQWGILGALLMRALFIATGIQLLERFHWVIFVFGGILVYTGVKLFFDSDDDDEHENFGNRWWIKLIQRYIPYVDEYGDGAFFISIQTSLVPPVTQLFATRLFFALITVELMDAVFALDSIPAILSLTSDPLVVYTSNIFAILGLRALYFAISGMVSEFHFLKYGLAIILVFIGVKMLISEYYKIPLVTALLFIVAVIVISVVASLYMKVKKDRGKAKNEDEVSSVVVNI
jgi:tellurite resistance protein TerC